MSASKELPERLAEIIADFKLAEGREKLELLLEYSQNLAPLPEALNHPHAPMEPVPECMTPVSVTAEIQNGGMVFYFRIPEESPTVRGYAAIIADGLKGASPEQVMNLPADFFLEMGLQQVLTPQRLNGMSAIIAHVKRLAMGILQTKN
ncbi:MAG: SufE family protein [Anaerolineae bacterium]|nr:SufE family protein [Anaerolineae bacterium]